MKRMYWLIGTLLVLALLLPACAPTAAPPPAAQGQPTAAPATAAPSQPTAAPAAGKVTVTYWFPVDLGGGLAKVMDSMVAKFNGAHPNIEVKAVYTGNYDATLQKIQAGQLAGNLPDVAVVVNEHTQTLAPLGILEPLDSFVQADGGKKFTDQYFPALLLNSYLNGKMYSLPFQRSVPVLYYNKDLFDQAGISKPPETWDEMEQDAIKLTQKQGGQVSRWGIEVPLEAYNWIYYAFVYEAGGKIISDDLKTLYLDQPPAIEAMNYWYKLVNTDHVTAAYTPWAQASQDFAAQKTAMVIYSSGSQAFFRDSAKFKWSLVKIPQDKQYGVAPGGGNILMFKKDAATEKAAWEFMKWMTSPEETAFWSMNSGYIAVQPAAWDLPVMKDYAKKYPEVLVTVDQLKNAYYEPGAPNYTKVRDLLHDTTQDILSGKISVTDGLKKVTQEGNKLLSQ
ncbi:MAG: ABC transporter substrate-binding protein [Chloroflexi bacterium]|nr:ABC transporter substrate-binding protein [Chloroflexota bacterium]